MTQCPNCTAHFDERHYLPDCPHNMKPKQNPADAIKEFGPHAFPSGNYQKGMDLRDYFAAHALHPITQVFAEPNIIAERCYAIADAMIERRKQ